MRRLLLMVLAGISLVLFVVTVRAWVRPAYGWGISPVAPGVVLYSQDEDLVVQYMPREAYIAEIASSDRHNNHGPYVHRSFFVGNWYSHELGRPLGLLPAGSLQIEALSLHCWFLSVILAIAPAWLGISFLMRRKVSPGTCAVCGYDLRATPRRCPECGRVPSAMA